MTRIFDNHTNRYKIKFNTFKGTEDNKFKLDRKLFFNKSREELTESIMEINPKSPYKRTFKLDGVSYKISEDKETGIIKLSSEDKGIHIPGKGFSGLIQLIDNIIDKDESILVQDLVKSGYGRMGWYHVVENNWDGISKNLREYKNTLNQPVTKDLLKNMNTFIEF